MSFLKAFLFTGEKKRFPYGLNAGSASRMDAHVGPLMPTQVTRVTAVSAPAVTFMATNLMDQTLSGMFMFLYADYITEVYVVYLCTSNQTVLFPCCIETGDP